MFSDSIDTKPPEPVDVEALRAYLSLNEGRVDDSYLLSLVTTARTMLEDHIGHVIATRAFTLSIGEREAKGPIAVHPDLLSVDSITYTAVDAEGTESTAEITAYTVHPHPIDPYITLDDGYPEDATGDIELMFTSGYDHVPECIVLAIKMMCLSLYNRSEESPLTDAVRRIVMPEVKFGL